MDSVCRAGLFGYLGHDPELFNDSISSNVLMGDEGDVWEYLRAVCLDGEVKEMEHGCETVIGSTGIRLSGGQAQRLALARTICHKRPVLILDDPFSALDMDTENKVFNNLRRYAADSIIIIISHRLYLFPEFDKVIWMENGRAVTGTHDEIMSKCSEYADFYKRQTGTANNK